MSRLRQNLTKHRGPEMLLPLQTTHVPFKGLQGVTRMAFSLRLWLMAICWWNKINQCRNLSKSDTNLRSLYEFWFRSRLHNRNLTGHPNHGMLLPNNDHIHHFHISDQNPQIYIHCLIRQTYALRSTTRQRHVPTNSTNTHSTQHNRTKKLMSSVWNTWTQVLEV